MVVVLIVTFFLAKVKVFVTIEVDADDDCGAGSVVTGGSQSPVEVVRMQVFHVLIRTTLLI